MMKYVVREYDQFDGLTLSFTVFADKAVAKAYNRHLKRHSWDGVCMYETRATVPDGYFTNGIYFLRLEMDGRNMD